MDKAVIEKCLAFCQALSAGNKLFSFGFKIGSDTFNFELKELVKGSCSKKNKSPSQLRRELRRREKNGQLQGLMKRSNKCLKIQSWM